MCLKINGTWLKSQKEKLWDLTTFFTLHVSPKKDIKMMMTAICHLDRLFRKTIFLCSCVLPKSKTERFCLIVTQSGLLISTITSV